MVPKARSARPFYSLFLLLLVRALLAFFFFFFSRQSCRLFPSLSRSSTTLALHDAPREKRHPSLFSTAIARYIPCLKSEGCFFFVLRLAGDAFPHVLCHLGESVVPPPFFSLRGSSLKRKVRAPSPSLPFRAENKYAGRYTPPLCMAEDFFSLAPLFVGESFSSDEISPPPLFRGTRARRPSRICPYEKVPQISPLFLLAPTSSWW